MGMVCGLFGKTRQSWYKQHKGLNEALLQDAIILDHIREIRQQMPRIGTRKLHYMLLPILAQHGIDVGRDKLFNLLATYGLLVRRRKRKKMFTTDSRHPFKKYPNLVRGLEVLRPDHLWVSDITYISLKNQYCYLSLITDAYSRSIRGYCLWPSLKKAGPLNALKMAMDSRPQSSDELIHHSDRGLQYCCTDYIDALTKRNILVRMTEKGDPYENALAERVNGILKSEFGLDSAFDSFEQAAEHVNKVIAIYNTLRPHASINYLTPHQADQQQGQIPAKWKPRKLKQWTNRELLCDSF